MQAEVFRGEGSCLQLSNNSTKTKINTHRGEGKPVQQNVNNFFGGEDMSIHCIAHSAFPYL